MKVGTVRVVTKVSGAGGQDGVWELPSKMYEGEGSIRITAERALQESAEGTPDSKVTILFSIQRTIASI